MTTTRPRRARRLLLALVPLLAITAACSAPETTVDPNAELAARPTLEQAVDRYRQMERRVQTEVDAVIGPRTWADQDEAGENVCGGEFNAVYDARTSILPRYGFNGGITAEQWPRVADAVNRVLRDYGFSTEGLVNIDRNGYRQISGIEPATGATFEFRTERNTNLRISTGCHLPAAKEP